MQTDFHTINKLIADKLDSGEPFSVIRIDNTAGHVIDCRLRGEYPSGEHYHERSLVEGGIYPHTVDYAYNYVIPPTIKALEDADIVGFVDCAQTLQQSPTIIETYKDKPSFFSHSFLIMDPGALLGLDTLHPYSWGAVADPWTAHLKGKKVLTISTHCESINHQWKNIDKVWGNNKDKIAPFELVGTIRSPYHPIMDNRQYPNCNAWHENVEYIKREMEKYDFDVLLSGATTSSPMYADHAKKMGKVGIQTGGTLQLFFGILGYRWAPEANNGYAPWAAMYNEHWIYPLKEDSAQQRENYKFLETNYAYW
jgi:hypothetical protein